MKPHSRILAATLLLCPLALPPAIAQERSPSSALINEQLDQLIKLELNKIALPQVFKTIEQQTGVPVRVTDDVYDILPWGTQTPITASLENLKLRDALNALGDKSGLKFELRDEYVECAPQPPLRRLGRRASLQELNTLDVLNTRIYPASGGNRLLSEVTTQLDNSLLQYDRELTAANKSPAKLVLEVRSRENLDPAKTPIALSRGNTLAGVLDAIDAQTPLTWYPWGDSVVILPKKDVIRSLLDRVVTLRYDGIDISSVLLDLSRKTNVPFLIEPGAIQRVTPEFRIINLSADATIRQSLESLQGYTGLGYVITDEGVYIWNQNSNPERRGRVIATVAVGGASVLVYEDQLSDEAKAALKARQTKAVADLESELLGTPTSQPVHHN